LTNGCGGGGFSVAVVNKRWIEPARLYDFLDQMISILDRTGFQTQMSALKFGLGFALIAAGAFFIFHKWS